MEVIVVIIIVLMLLLVPLKLAAGWCKASNNSWTTCIIAVIGSVVANKVSQNMLADPLLALLAVMGLTMVFYSLIFGVTLLRGGLIALLSVGIQNVVALVLVGIGWTLAA